MAEVAGPLPKTPESRGGDSFATKDAQCCRLEEVPLVDVSALWAPGSTEQKRAAVDAALAHACATAGFFRCTGHGVPQSIIDKAFAASHAFMTAQTDEDKRSLAPRAYNRQNANAYRGYFPATVMGKEGFDIGNPSATSVAEPGVTVAKGKEATPFPPSLPSFRNTMLAYREAMWQLAKVLIDSVGRGLGLGDGFFFREGAFRDESHMSTLRLNYYPDRRPISNNSAVAASQCGIPSSDGRELACEEHADGCFFTVLYQDAVGGLQVDDRAGGWLDVPPAPGQFVVNVGKLMQEWSGNRAHAGVHRVLFTQKERFSIPFFVEPSPDAAVKFHGKQEPYEQFLERSLKNFREYQRPN